MSPNKQLQRVVLDKVPSHNLQRAAAELGVGQHLRVVIG